MISIAIEGVAYTYPGGVRALDGIDLAIEPGETLAIVGQNGSGKSTLVRQLNGLLRPAEGRILLDGSPIEGRHVADLARLVGIAFQDPDRQIFAGRTWSEVAFGPRNLGLRGAALERRVAAALEAVGLDDAATENPYDLGYSRRKLLSIASVLAMETPVIVLDEPTTGQDLRGVARVRSIVAALAADGRTVITISHDMRFVRRDVPPGRGHARGSRRPGRDPCRRVRRGELGRARLHLPRAAACGEGWGPPAPR